MRKRSRKSRGPCYPAPCQRFFSAYPNGHLCCRQTRRRLESTLMEIVTCRHHSPGNRTRSHWETEADNERMRRAKVGARWHWQVGWPLQQRAGNLATEAAPGRQCERNWAKGRLERVSQTTDAVGWIGEHGPLGQVPSEKNTTLRLIAKRENFHQAPQGAALWSTCHRQISDDDGALRPDDAALRYELEPAACVGQTGH